MNSTLFYTVYMYQQSFEYYNTGYGAALAWVMLLIVGLFLPLFLQKIKKHSLSLRLCAHRSSVTA